MIYVIDTKSKARCWCSLFGEVSLDFPPTDGVGIAATLRHAEGITSKNMKSLGDWVIGEYARIGAISIKRVIFNEPATIVFWSDGTKTVVKCGKHDRFDPEKGLAIAIAKKAMGNKGSFNNAINKAIKEAQWQKR